MLLDRVLEQQPFGIILHYLEREVAQIDPRAVAQHQFAGGPVQMRDER